MKINNILIIFLYKYVEKESPLIYNTIKYINMEVKYEYFKSTEFKQNLWNERN